MSEAVQRLPSFAPSPSEQAKATGTDSVLPDSLPEKRTIPPTTVRGSASALDHSDEAQPLGKTGTYGDCERIETRGSASSATPHKPPPRGIEPLLPDVQVVEGQALTSTADVVLPDCLPDSAQNDPELAAVVTAWPGLPEAVKAGIVAMVKATRQDR